MATLYLLDAHLILLLLLLSGGNMPPSCSPGEPSVDPMVEGVCAPSAELVESEVEAIAVGVRMRWWSSDRAGRWQLSFIQSGTALEVPSLRSQVTTAAPL
jgi:hypothetical protein